MAEDGGQGQGGGRQGPAVRLRSFSRSLPMRLLLAREAVMNRFRPSLHLFRVTEQQWRVLRALGAIREIEVTELARATSLLAPSLSRILRDLEARGLIERRPAPGDLRRALISIAPRGLALIDAVAPYSEAVYAEIADTFGQERLEHLQTLLTELTEALNRLPPVIHAEGELDAATAGLIDPVPRGRPRGGRAGQAETEAGE